VLGAVLEVIRAQGMDASPTAIFAATMLSLEKPEARASPEILAAMCHLLSLALGRVPEPAVKAKADQTLALILSVAEGTAEKPAAAMHVLDCLAQVLRAADPTGSAPALAAFRALLSGSIDPRPKVRRKAQSALTEVLAANQGRPSAESLSGAILEASARILPRPQQAAVEAAQAPNKRRKEAEAAIQQAVSEALHWLGALRSVAPLMSRQHVTQLCEESVGLYALGQPLLSVHVSEVLAAIAASTASRVSPKTLASVLVSPRPRYPHACLAGGGRARRAAEEDSLKCEDSRSRQGLAMETSTGPADETFVESRSETTLRRPPPALPLS